MEAKENQPSESASKKSKKNPKSSTPSTSGPSKISQNPTRSLTRKQLKLVNELKKDPTSVAKAARKAGMNVRHAQKLVNPKTNPKTTQNNAVSETMDVFMQHFNKQVPDSLVARQVRNGLMAKKVEVVKYEGEITDEKSYPDLPTRLKAADIAIRVKDKYPRPETFEQTNKITADKVLIVYGDPSANSGEVMDQIQTPLRKRPYDPSKSRKTPRR